MLNEKFQSVVNSCYSLDQLVTCERFADQAYGDHGEKRTWAGAVIQQHRNALARNAAPEGRYPSPVPGADPTLHTMD